MVQGQPATPHRSRPGVLLRRAARAGDGEAVRRLLDSGDTTPVERAQAIVVACRATTDAAIRAFLDAGSPCPGASGLSFLLRRGHVEVFLRLLAADSGYLAHLTPLLEQAARFRRWPVVEAWPALESSGVHALWKGLLSPTHALWRGGLHSPAKPMSQAGLDALWARFPLPGDSPLYREFLLDGLRRGSLPLGMHPGLTQADAMAPAYPRNPLPMVALTLDKGHLLLSRRLIALLKEASPAWSEPSEGFCASLCVYAAHHASLTLLKDIAGLKGWKGGDLAILAPGGKGETLIHHALQANFRLPSRIAFIRFLLSHGADPGARDHAGRGPLHHAAQTARLGSETVLDVLDAAGADWSARDKSGATPLDLLSHVALSRHWTGVLAARGLDEAMRASPRPARPAIRF